MQCGTPGFDPCDGEIPWRRAWQPSPVFLPGEFPWTEEPGGPSFMGCQVSHMTEQPNTAHTEVVRVGPSSHRIWYPYERKRYQRSLSLFLHTYPEEMLCEETERRWWTTVQEECFHHELNLLAPLSWTSSILNYEKLNVLCLSYPACGIWFWQLEQTNTSSITQERSRAIGPTGCLKPILYIDVLMQHF